MRSDGDKLGKANDLIHTRVKRKWQSYIWDTLDKSQEERRFLFKLDFALLTFASLGKWCENFLVILTC